MVGLIFEVIVRHKDKDRKILQVTLNKLHSICDKCNSNQLKESDILMFRQKYAQIEELQRIFAYNITATITEHDLVQTFILGLANFSKDLIYFGSF